jgi:phage tail-like protein
MADNYPIPVFHYQVQWGGTNIGFSEVSGLNMETQAIEYRDGASKEYSSIKMPGIPKFSNITLKRGIIKGDNEFYVWLTTTKMNVPARRDLIISLLNENHEPVVTWKAKNCFPLKVDGPSLKSTGNEVAIESIEIAHEGITIENG